LKPQWEPFRIVVFMITISAQRLSKTFRASDGAPVHALDRVDLAVNEGEYLVLLGPSGSGKTTLLRLFAGLEVADEGNLQFQQDPASSRSPNTEVAMVFPESALYPHLDVRRNLELGLTIRRLPSQEIRARMAEVVALCQIEEALLSRRPEELSTGQRKRVALARALVRRPGLLLLDEPCSALDVPARDVLRVELRRIRQKRSCTIIHATHDQAEALSLGDRVAVLDRGRVMQCSEPRAIYEEPASLSVARFMGSPPMNLVEGVLELGSDESRWFVVRDRANRTILSIPWNPVLGSEDHPGSGVPIVMGFRAEAVQCAGRVGIDGRGWVGPMPVVDVEYRGSDWIVTCEGFGVTWRACQSSFGSPFAIGDEVFLRVDVSRCSWFDARTEQRLRST